MSVEQANPFNYKYDVSHPLHFLQEVSEHYANAHYFKDTSPDEILSYAERQLARIPSIAAHINEIRTGSGESEMTFVFGWECTDDVELMAGWFKLLRYLGGDPIHHRNRDGLTALEVVQKRLRHLGYDDKESEEIVDALMR